MKRQVPPGARRALAAVGVILTCAAAFTLSSPAGGARAEVRPQPSVAVTPKVPTPAPIYRICENRPEGVDNCTAIPVIKVSKLSGKPVTVLNLQSRSNPYDRRVALWVFDVQGTLSTYKVKGVSPHWVAQHDNLEVAYVRLWIKTSLCLNLASPSSNQVVLGPCGKYLWAFSIWGGQLWSFSTVPPAEEKSHPPVLTFPSNLAGTCHTAPYDGAETQDLDFQIAGLL